MTGLHRIRASLGRTKKRQRDEEMARRQRAAEDYTLKVVARREGYDAKQREFTKLVAPERGVTFLQPPPDHDQVAVAIPPPPLDLNLSVASFDVSRSVGVMYFRANRMRHDVGNGVVADFFTWEPVGFTPNPELVDGWRRPR